MAYLKNNYKIMYENRDLSVSPADINLRATKTLPAAADTNLVYKKEDGTTIDPKEFKFIKEVNGNFYGSLSGKPSEATIKFSVYSGEDCIYGDEVQPGPVVAKFPVSANATVNPDTFDVCWNFEGDDPVTAKVTKMIDKDTKVKIYIEPNFAAEWDVAPTTCKVNGVDTALTLYQSGFYFIEVTVNNQIEVVFDTGTTRVPLP